MYEQNTTQETKKKCLRVRMCKKESNMEGIEESEIS